MSSEESEKALYLSRIASRMAVLRAAGVLHASAPLARLDLESPVDSLMAELMRWTVYFDSTRQLFEEILPAARVEPGRLYERYVEVQRGMPRGSVQWPRTLARRMGRETSTEFEFVCSGSRRILVSPENVLLTITLEEVAERRTGALARILASGHMGQRETRLVQSFRTQARRALSSPPFVDCRSEVREVRNAGANALLNLETSVRARAKRKPAAAPRWAAQLFDARRQQEWVPPNLVRSKIELSTLWQLFARIELVALMNDLWTLRQLRSDPSRFSYASRVLEPLESRNGFAIRESERSRIAFSIDKSTNWESVRAKAAHNVWYESHASSNVDRWVVLHRCDRADRVVEMDRGGLSLCFVQLDASHGLPPESREIVRNWLAA